MINKITVRKMFLVDGLGALVSAFLLGVVLVHFQKYFGIPVKALYILAALPVGFAIYDFYCFYFLKSKHAFFLKIIAYLNLFYCLLSIGFAIYHKTEILPLGWMYIIGELLILFIMVRIELGIANKN